MEAIATIETVLDHVSVHLNKDPLEVREINFSPDKPPSEGGPNVAKNTLLPMLKESAMIDQRKAQVKAFNKVNKQ